MPGQTALITMPLFAYSNAALCVRPMMQCAFSFPGPYGLHESWGYNASKNGVMGLSF
jgi:hypothetical protein